MGRGRKKNNESGAGEPSQPSGSSGQNQGGQRQQNPNQPHRQPQQGDGTTGQSQQQPPKQFKGDRQQPRNQDFTSESSQTGGSSTQSRGAHQPQRQHDEGSAGYSAQQRHQGQQQQHQKNPHPQEQGGQQQRNPQHQQQGQGGQKQRNPQHQPGRDGQQQIHPLQQQQRQGEQQQRQPQQQQPQQQQGQRGQQHRKPHQQGQGGQQQRNQQHQQAGGHTQYHGQQIHPQPSGSQGPNIWGPKPSIPQQQDQPQKLLDDVSKQQSPISAIPSTSAVSKIQIEDVSRQQSPISPSSSASSVSQPKSPTKSSHKVTEDSLAVLQLAQPANGTRGSKCIVETNYLTLDLSKLPSTAYHYDVHIEPDRPKKLMPLVFRTCCQSHFRGLAIAYDGRNSAYTTRKLEKVQKKKPFEIEVVYNDGETGRDRTFKVIIKETDSLTVDLSSIQKYVSSRSVFEKPLRAIQVLEVAMRMAFDGNAICIGRSFFRRPRDPIDLGEGYELWTGLFQSIIIGEKPFLNVDVSNKGFPSPQNLLDVIKSIRYADINRDLDPKIVAQLQTRLKRLNICYKPPNRAGCAIYRFNGFKDSTRRQTFMKDGEKMTVEQYFKSVNLPLKYPLMPCVWVGPEVRNIYLPAEFCFIQEGQALMKKLSPGQTQQMIKQTATSTDNRKSKIMQLLQDIRHNTNPVVKEFGINVGDRFQNINARVIQAPLLTYNKNDRVPVANGEWSCQGAHFIDAKSLTNWAILVLDDRTEESTVRKFADMISRNGRDLNMNINPKYEINKMRPTSRDDEFEQKMKQFKDKRIELLFVIIPTFIDVYPKVKQTAELKCGILTQCIKSVTLDRRLNGSTVVNILLKINSKLNGTNHKINGSLIPPIMRENVMLVGADVTHPAGDLSEPSVVGVAASHDFNNFKYNICWRLQHPTKEMIIDLKLIMIEQLKYYQSQMTNKLPEKILYYRDGVSDGQFQEVLDIELKAINAACANFGADYKPKITFIVVQKRHHTRFFPTDRKFSSGRNNNVLPGTVVDSTIIDPKQYQFFLVSHQAIQGVAKPTKYCVLHDDSNIHPDQLQAATYNLCHLFTRCNRSVSYVAPTYYAHHAAYRGKMYITGQRIDLNNLDREFNRRQIKTEIVHGHPMFFV